MKTLYNLFELIAHAEDLAADPPSYNYPPKRAEDTERNEAYLSRPEITWEDGGSQYTAEIIVRYTTKDRKGGLTTTFTRNGQPISFDAVKDSFKRLRAAAQKTGKLAAVDVCIKALADEYGSYTYNGYDYVLLQCAYPYGDDGGYQAPAIRSDSVVDEDGYTLVYMVYWDCLYPATDDGSLACDWDDLTDCARIRASYYNIDSDICV